MNTDYPLGFINNVVNEFQKHCKKMKFFIKDFLSKCDQTRSFLRIYSHLQKKSKMENFIFFPGKGKECRDESFIIPPSLFEITKPFIFVEIFYFEMNEI